MWRPPAQLVIIIIVHICVHLVAERYRIQCDSFAYMWHMMRELVTRLACQFKMGSSSDFRIYYDSPLPLQEYFEIIDQHFEVSTMWVYFSVTYLQCIV